MVIHPQARTTPKLRAEIKAQRDRKQVDLAKQYNVTPQTIRKWQNRDEFTDKSHRPHRLQTKLSEHQEMLVVELRKLLLLPLDDLLVIVREFIHPEATRSGIHRTLRRHGVSHLNALLRAENEEEAQPAKRKTFKDYAPGFVHVDVKHLPQMADESRRTYLFVAIDRATRWVYLEILPDKSARSAKGFLKQLIKKAPFIITRVLTDNGKEFTDRFIANGERKPTGQHPFDQVCQAEGIEHRLIKPKHPQTNGMVERFNGRISEILATTHFDASRDLQETLYQYQKIYNYHVPQKNIGHITPIQALKDWHKKQPELFKKKIYDLSGLDSYKPTPAKRIHLEKPDGSLRPIQLQNIEDKIVQSATAEILNSIYESDFAAFSYGFRPGKSQHQALQALQTVLQKGKVNWVLDLDLKACFDRIDHTALMDVIQKRIADKRLLNLIQKWLTVGYREEGQKRQKQKRGTPQGAIISPLLANIVLNEAMDSYVRHWRKRHARGEVYIVRYADDAILSFEHKADADALRTALEEQLQRYGLELNEAKTHLRRFGRNSSRGGGRSETFDFLGLTYIAGKDRRGRYLVKRKTARKKMRRSLELMRLWCRKHRHEPLAWQWKELSAKLRGHYAYYGIRGNLRSLGEYRYQVWKYWRQCLRKRSQKGNKARLTILLNETFVLPKPKIMRPDNWLPLNPGDLLGRAGCGKSARPVL